MLHSPANEITIGIPSDPYSIDPIFSTDLSSRKINSFIFEKLFDDINVGTEKNHITKRSYWVKSGQKWALGVLLKNKFSSGKSITSDDVIFSLKRLRDFDGPRKNDYSFILDIKKISKFEFQIITDTKSDKYMELLSSSFASVYDAESFQNEKKFISTGPYSLETWERNDKIVLKRNPFYKENNLPEKLILRVLPQSATGVFLFKKKSLDVFKIPFFLVDEFRKSHSLVVKKQGNSVQYIAINNTNPCFDKNFRKALNFSINKKLIISKLLEGNAESVYGPLPKKYYPKVDKKETEETYRYDKDKAVMHLKRSTCYPEIMKRKLDFRMRGDDENKSVGLSIQKYLNEIGLSVSISPMEKIQLYKENGEKKGDLTLLTWYLDSDSIVNLIDPIFSSVSQGNGGNRSFYSNKFIQNQIDRIQKESALKKNKKYLKEIFEKIHEDAPWIFLWSVDENYIFSEKAKAFPRLQEFL